MRRLALAAAPFVVLLGVTAVLASFSASGSGHAAASLGTLTAPAAPTAAPGAGTVALSWSSLAPPTGSDTVTYYVQRDGANAGGNCSTKASPSTATSCTDSGLTAGTYHYTVTAVWRSWSATSSSTTVTVASGPLDHFSLSATTTTPTAGAGDNLTITAKDSAGNTVTAYGGDQTLSFSGASTIGSNQPTVTSKTGTAVTFGTAETITFTNGIASVAGSNNGVMTLYKAESATVTVSDGAHTGNLSVTVGPATAAAFTVSAPGSATAGSAISATLTAKDAYGNTATGYTGSHTIDFSGPHTSPGGTSPSYPASVSFTSGGGTASVTLYDAETTTLTAADHLIPSITGASGSIVVGPGSAASLALSAASTTPTAGAADNLTVTAKDNWLNTAASYTGSKNLTFGGAGSIGANNPTVTNSSGTAIAFGSTTAITFTSGIASVSGSSNGVMTLYKAETATVTVTDGTRTGNLSVTVGAAAVANIAATSGGGQSANVGSSFTNPLSTTVTDTYGNPKSGVSVTFGAPASGASSTFASGGNCTSNPQTYQCVATTNNSGVATSSAFTANTVQGTYNISATAGGGSNPSVNFSETNIGLLHISSLTTGATSGSTTWTGSITVTVTDSSGTAVNGVSVSGAWSPTSGASGNCTTNASGQCTITPAAGAFPSGQLTETWTVSNLSLSGYSYASASNVESAVTLSLSCAAATVCQTTLTSATAFTDSTAGTSSSTATLSAGNTPPSGSTVLILIARNGSQSGDAVSSVAGSAISNPTLVTSNANNLSTNAGAFTNLWVYRAQGTGTTSSPAVTVTFSKSDNLATLVQVIVLSGENTKTPIAQSNGTNKCTASCTTTATATLTSSLSTGSKEIVLVGEAKDTLTAMTSSSWATKMFWAHFSNPSTGANYGSFFGTSTASGTVTLGTANVWGAIALEVARST